MLGVVTVHVQKNLSCDTYVSQCHDITFGRKNIRALAIIRNERTHTFCFFMKKNRVMIFSHYTVYKKSADSKNRQ